MVNASIKHTKSCMLIGFFIMVVYFLSGCTTLPIGRDTIALNNNHLTVKVKHNNRVHKAQAMYPYGLYRLAVNQGHENQYHYRNRPGIVRLPYVRTQDYYLVEPRPVAIAQPVDNVVTFELPILEGPETCYTVVSMGSFAMPYANWGNVSETHFIDLKAYHDSSSSLKKVQFLKAEKENNKRAKQILLSKLDSACLVLNKNRAYVNGECLFPAMGSLPRRPPDAYPHDEAKAIAHQVVFQYFGDRVGCHAVKGIFKNRSFKRFLDQYKCGDKRYMRFFKQDEYSVLFDLIEAILLNCKKESQDTCMALYSGIVIVRALSTIDEITNRLYLPYQSWQRTVHRIRSEPERTRQQCSSALTLWSNREQKLAIADKKIELSEKRLADAKKEVDYNLTRTTVDLVCHEDPNRYINTDRGSVFVSPR